MKTSDAYPASARAAIGFNTSESDTAEPGTTLDDELASHIDGVITLGGATTAND